MKLADEQIDELVRDALYTEGLVPAARTEWQLRACRTSFRAGLEAAAKVCDEYQGAWYGVADHCAAAIRALAKEE